MRKKRSPLYQPQNYRRYTEPSSKLHLDPIGETTRIKAALHHVVPLFLINRPDATAPMLAAVMRVSEVYKDANNDDVANVLVNLDLRPTLKNGNLYFNLSTYVDQEPKQKTILRRGENERV